LPDHQAFLGKNLGKVHRQKGQWQAGILFICGSLTWISTEEN
jgi:hypothetical protein